MLMGVQDARAQQAVPIPSLSLMPVPASVEMGQGRLTINAQFAATCRGVADARLLRAVERALVRIAARTALDIDPRCMRVNA
jgi:hypothetical protein